MASDAVVVKESDGVVRLVDSALSTWVLEAVPLDYEPAPRSELTSGMAATLAATLADEFPRFNELLRTGRGFVVRFSPEVERGLREGTYELVRSGTTAKAVARNTGTGQVAEFGAVVVGGAALAGPAWP